jgi:hypothetical protein
MSKDHGQGIFTMDVITSVSKCKILGEAKGRALEAITSNETALLKNRIKAERLCHAARSVSELAIAMTNFSLSHQGLKVLR